jgi:hypothetical protein
MRPILESWLPTASIGLVSASLLLPACGSQPAETRAGEKASEMPAVVDSIFPMDVMLARFRADLPEPERLTSGASSLDGLVDSLVRALVSSDTMAFERLAVNRAEFAWLYFPGSVNAKPPYELPPALAWFRLEEANRSGVFRALREYGGRRLDYRGYRCSPEPVMEGDTRLRTGCTLTIARNGDEPVEVKFFSSILQRDGRFAVLSYDNDF